MHGLSDFSVLPKQGEVFFGERVDHEYPLVKKVVQSFCIPPVQIKNSLFHSSDFSYGWDDVLKNHEIQTDINVEDGRDEPEKQLNEPVFL